jgi:hypothetical protein
LINGNDIPNIDPFKDDGSKLLDVLLSRSTDNEDDSTWDPEDNECNNIHNNSFEMTMSAMEKIKMKVNVSPFVVLSELIV